MKIFLNPKMTFTDLYLDLALSNSSLSRHIRQLNVFLKPYHCSINFRQSFSPLQGEEHQIRFLYYNILWGLNLDKIIGDAPKIEQVMQSLSKLLPHISYITLSKVKLGLYIQQLASKLGVFVHSEEPFVLPNSPFITYEEFFQILDTADFLNDCPDLSTKQKEARYLYFVFCHTNVLTLEESEQHEKQIAISNYPNVQYFIKAFQKQFDFSLEAYEIKFLSYNLTLYHCEANVYRGRVKTFDLETLVHNFNNNEANIPKPIEEFINHICHENDEIRVFIQNFPSLYYYYTMLLRIIVSKHYQPLKILVQSSISRLHRQELISQIINSTPFPIEVYTPEQLNGERPDGIVSNWLPDEKYQDVPFFSTSLFYTEWHKGDLELFLSRLEISKNNYK